MNAIIERARTEPVLVVALVEALLALALVFGLNISVEQVGAIMLVVNAALAFVVRSKVSPV